MLFTKSIARILLLFGFMGKPKKNAAFLFQGKRRFSLSEQH